MKKPRPSALPGAGMGLFSLVSIKPGDETFFDYGTEYRDALGVTPNSVTSAA